MLLWLLGVPIPILVLIWLFGGLTRRMIEVAMLPRSQRRVAIATRI